MITTSRTGIDHDEIAAIHEPSSPRSRSAIPSAPRQAMRRHFEVLGSLLEERTHMTRLVDLSMPVHRDMLTFPRVPPPDMRIYESWQEFAERIGAAEHGADWLTASYIVIQNDHVGTHCDAVKHLRGPDAPGRRRHPARVLLLGRRRLDFTDQRIRLPDLSVTISTKRSRRSATRSSSVTSC